jgi:hypothetical protein
LATDTPGTVQLPNLLTTCSSLYVTLERYLRTSGECPVAREAVEAALYAAADVFVMHEEFRMQTTHDGKVTVQ